MTSGSKEAFARLLYAVWQVHDAAAYAIRGPLAGASLAGIDVHPDHHELRELRDAIGGAQDAFENLEAAWSDG
jgi:hypothetical protein